MPYISHTREVVKLERLMDSAPQRSNIRDILVTFSVLKQLRSRLVSNGVFPNMPNMEEARDVSKQ